jgi:hypothetical protein
VETEVAAAPAAEAAQDHSPMTTVHRQPARTAQEQEEAESIGV